MKKLVKESLNESAPRHSGTRLEANGSDISVYKSHSDMFLTIFGGKWIANSLVDAYNTVNNL